MRHVLPLAALLLIVGVANADIRTYGFDDGTYQGWDFVDMELENLKDGAVDSAMLWKISIEDIDLGENDWDLLQGSTVNGIGTPDNPQRVPNYRVIPDPWSARDCIGTDCLSMLFRSPIFKMDDSGPISVDIMGGQGAGGRNVDPNVDDLPETIEDFRFFKGDNLDGIALQGFGLYDVAEERYVEFGFPTINNDGKERDGRGVWETVEIPAEDLAPYAGDGKDYRVDVFDSLSGGWGWIAFDTVRVPDAGYEDPTLAFDCDGSGATDAGDLGCITTVDERDEVLAALNSLPGDLDGTEGVAFADFLTLSANYGAVEGTYAQGNVDMMGGIEFADFLILSANFGNGGTAAATVPEPSAGLLAFFAVAAACTTRKRRQK